MPEYQMFVQDELGEVILPYIVVIVLLGEIKFLLSYKFILDVLLCRIVVSTTLIASCLDICAFTEEIQQNTNMIINNLFIHLYVL